MRSRSAMAMLLLGSGVAQAQDLLVYDDALRNGFQDYSYGDHALNHASPALGTASIRFTPGAYTGVQFVIDPGANRRFTDYQSLQFSVHGGSAGGQSLEVYFVLDGFLVARYDLTPFVAGGAIAAGEWRTVTVPFDASTTLTHGGFDGVALQERLGQSQPALYIDNLRFVARSSAIASPAIAVSVDTSLDRRAIDAEAYGVNFGETAQSQSLRYPVRRWGGNSTTRYNWKVDVHSTAADYVFQNIVDTPDGTPLPNGSSADQFMDFTRSIGAQALMTVNTLGRQPVDVRQKRWSYSISKYGAQTGNECTFYFGNNPPTPGHFCSLDSGNGICTAGPNCLGGFILNDPNDTSMVVGPDFTADWVEHMQQRYGTAANGGIRYFALDNEPMLWNSTHRDMRAREPAPSNIPEPPTFDEVWTKGRDIAIAIKQQDPGALIFGPVTWGWCDLFGSAFDAAHSQFGSCIDGPDRAAHGGLPFVRWYLQQARAYEMANNVRLIDYLDVHFYPQADNVASTFTNMAADEDRPAAARRMRSVKELYDNAYVSESYVNDVVRLIPRLREWIALDYPGTKLAITEYKWGPDDGPSGALAQAEVLAIFAREGVDLAARWVAPEPGSRAENAFRMFLDHDGNHTRLTGHAVRATSGSADALGAYAIEAANGVLYVLLFNRDTAPHDVNLTLAAGRTGNWSLRRFDATTDLSVVGTGSITGTSLSLSGLPGRSANLLVLPAGSAGGIFADGFE